MSRLSQDLRKRILNHAKTHSIRRTAEAFSVSPDAVFRLKKLHAETGGTLPRQRGPRQNRSVSDAGELYLKSVIAEDSDVTLGSLCETYLRVYGVSVALSTMHGTLKRMGITLKKKQTTTRRKTATGMPPKKKATSRR